MRHDAIASVGSADRAVLTSRLRRLLLLASYLSSIPPGRSAGR